MTDLDGRRRRARRALGLVLLARLLVHPRRQHPAVGARRATASGSRTSSAPGTTSSARSGCVGCGRCITWCPVGIDVTEELAAIRASEESRPCRRIDDHRSTRSRSSQGLDRRPARADRRLRLERRASARASCSSARATTADTFYVVRHGQRRARDVRPGPRRGRDRDARPGRGRRLVVALRRRTAGTSTRARSTLVRAIAFDGACLRGKCESDPALGYDLMSPLRAGDDRAAAVRRGSGSWTCMATRQQLSAAAARGPMAPRAVPRRRDARARPPTRGRSSSSRSPASGSHRARASSRCSTPSASARCRSRSAAPRPTAPLVHTIRAVGAVTQAICALAAGRRARRARPVRQRVAGRRGASAATSWSSPAASGSPPLRPAVYHAPRAPRRVRRGRRSSTAPHAGRPALPRGARALARPVRRRGRRHRRRRRRATGAATSASSRS